MTFFFSRNSFLIHLFVYRDKTDTLYLLAFDRIFIIIYQLPIFINYCYEKLLKKINFEKIFKNFSFVKKGKVSTEF